LQGNGEYHGKHHKSIQGHALFGRSDAGLMKWKASVGNRPDGRRVRRWTLGQGITKNGMKRTTYKNSILGCALLGVLVAGQAMAADIRYMNSGDYLEPTGWQGGVIPA